MFGLIWLSGVECRFKNKAQGTVAFNVIALSPILPPKIVDKSSVSGGCVMMAEVKVNQGASAQVVRTRDREVKSLLEKRAVSLRPTCTPLVDHWSAKKAVAQIKATLQVVPMLFCRQQGGSGSIQRPDLSARSCCGEH